MFRVLTTWPRAGIATENAIKCSQINITFPKHDHRLILILLDSHNQYSVVNREISASEKICCFKRFILVIPLWVLKRNKNKKTNKKTSVTVTQSKDLTGHWTVVRRRSIVPQYPFRVTGRLYKVSQLRFRGEIQSGKIQIPDSLIKESTIRVWPTTQEWMSWGWLSGNLTLCANAGV